MKKYLLLCLSFVFLYVTSPSVFGVDYIYQSPIVITKGGTYTGNYRSTNANIPAIKISTTQPVILENCNVKSRTTAVFLDYSADVTIRNSRIECENPLVSGKTIGRAIQAQNPKNFIIS